MKKLNIWYWIVTGLFVVFMLFSGITNLWVTPESVQLVSDHLGYPHYFVAYIGLAKMVGAVVLVLPGLPRLKEWAYAGLFYDLLTATFSFYAVGDPVVQWLPMLVFMMVLFASYMLYHRRLSRR
jgi:hypothetical protein